MKWDLLSEHSSRVINIAFLLIPRAASEHLLKYDVIFSGVIINSFSLCFSSCASTNLRAQIRTHSELHLFIAAVSVSWFRADTISWR